MKDDLTEEQKYDRWVRAVLKCRDKGWFCQAGYCSFDKWIFKSPSGTLHNLSAADLDKLDSIEENGSFLVEG